MAIVQPVYGPQYGDIVRNALGVYGQIKGIKAQESQMQRQKRLDERQIQMEQLSAKEKADKKAQDEEVKRLAVMAGKDPESMQKLMALNPSLATKIQENQREGRNEDIKNTERFAKESSQFAASIRGLPPEQKIKALRSRVEQLRAEDRDGVGKGGIDPAATTQRLLTAYEEGLQAQQGLQNARSFDEAQFLSQKAEKLKEADDAIEQRYQFGLQAGYVKKPEKPEEKYRVATPEEKAQAGITDGGQYQISPKGQFTKLGGSGQTINVNTGTGAGADAGIFKKEMAKSQVQRYDQINEAATQAEEQNYTLDELEAMDVKTGALEPLKVQLGSIGESLGIDMSSLANVTAGQAYDAKGKKMVLGEMQKQKGPQTESDMKMIAKTVTNLGSTPEANKFIIKSIRAQNLRKVEQRDFMENYLQENGNLDGADRAWNKYKKDVPMISRNIKTPEGLPVFYNEFERAVMEANPDARREDIAAAWRERDAAAKKEQKPVSIPKETLQRPIPLSINTTYGQQPEGEYGEPVRPGQTTGRYGL